MMIHNILDLERQMPFFLWRWKIGGTHTITDIATLIVSVNC